MSYNLIHSDAPGWAYKEQKNEKPPHSTGPLCWKCQGTTKIKEKKRKKDDTNKLEYINCTVCLGKGYIPAKKKEIDGKSNPGVVTRRSRFRNSNIGPIPYAIRNKSNQDEDYIKAVNLVENAIHEHVYIQENENYPNWIPKNGEELVNLVGSWRLLQCVGSHRWTTDDLVTAYIASNEFLKSMDDDYSQYKYCDLGCGNGSVLQMTLWKLLQSHSNLNAVGVEARQEAYTLAKRSIEFNIGYDEKNALCNVTLRNHDFRILFDSGDYYDYFDFVTGTPPYFKIEHDDRNAIIKQGGMPTCLQSAPARCEFRGGVEAYCEVACNIMKPNGVFAVTEAWIHHTRVLKAAESFGLKIMYVQPIEGRIGKPQPLFAVYVMRKCVGDDAAMEILPHVAVRDEVGKWTKDYCKILEYMNIPT